MTAEGESHRGADGAAEPTGAELRQRLESGFDDAMRSAVTDDDLAQAHEMLAAAHRDPSETDGGQDTRNSSWSNAQQVLALRLSSVQPSGAPHRPDPPEVRALVGAVGLAFALQVEETSGVLTR